MIETFCWGTKEKLIDTPKLIVDKLNLQGGGYSSIHSHKYQNNFMYLIEGEIRIEYFYSDKTETGHFDLNIYHPQILIEPNPILFHRFRAFKPSVVIEIITSFKNRFTDEVSRDDIIRLTERGIDK